MPRALVIFWGLVGFLASAGAQPLPPPAPVWRLMGPAEPVQAGVPFTVRAVVQLPRDYYQDADSPFLAFEVASPAVTLERRHSSAGERLGKVAFTGTFELERTVVVNEKLPPGPLVLPVALGWQICQEDGVCLLPVDAKGTVEVTWDGASPPSASVLWGAVVAAFVGGLLLNIMPCVFPVLALKAVSLASRSAQSRGRQRRGALAFAAGSFATVQLLGLLTAAAAWGGHRLDWGFAFQIPAVVWALTVVFAALSLQLLGLLRWPMLSFSSTVGTERAGRDFLGGAFLVVAAAPCTAPLLGPALGFALTRPAVEIPLYFAAIGGGLALPFVLAGLFPFWGRWLPRPGRWLQTVERSAGVLLLATVAYLLWIFWVQNGALRGSWAVTLLALAGAVAVAWRSPVLGGRPAVRRVLGAGLLLASVILTLLPSSPVRPALPPGWQEYSEPRLAEALEAEQSVLVDGTAAWCATCQVNELTVLQRPDVVDRLDALGVVLLRADYTSPQPSVARWLASVDRAGLPVYALYRPGKPVFLFPELLSDDNFMAPLVALVGSR